MKLEPEHFDWLGIVTFPFIFAVGAYALANLDTIPSWTAWLLTMIGIGGFIIDGTIVYTHFIRRK